MAETDRPEWEFTAGALTDILTADPACRHRWQRHAVRNSGLPNQAAVSAVLTRWMWQQGQVPTISTAPRSRKDRVSRARRGELISPGTLAMFIDAFGMSEEQSAQLYDAYLRDALRQRGSQLCRSRPV